MFRVSLIALAATVSAPALAAGDLLVAPTRIVMESGRGTEVILNNVGAAPATYRISVELLRMTRDGRMEEVVPGTETDREKAALAMISYAPRRVTLPPNQPQVIRVGARIPVDTPDGEYRGHMLFRAVPEATPVTDPQQTQGVSVALNVQYGVRIPVIVRKGPLKASATLSDVHLSQVDGRPALAFSLTRTGDRSVYGNIRVTKAGVAKPVFEAKGLAIYAELPARTVALTLRPEEAAAMTGAVTVKYLEDNDTGSVIAQADGVLR